MSQTASVRAGGVGGVHASRLFKASCIGLITGAAMFAIGADIILALKQEFALTNEQIGWMRSGGAVGFPLSMFVLGPLVDVLGMRRLIWFAVATHVLGVALMISATAVPAFAFWMLFAGMLVHAVGSGIIEAVCNPLIATIYPDAKTEKLNRFHMWFPGGIVLGGVACYILSRTGIGFWQLKVAMVLAPTAVYLFLFVGQTCPPTERVRSGVSFGGMFRETLLRPLFLLLLVCMMLTASLELGPNGWIPPVLEAGGVPGILVLVWITGLMAVLRYYAGPVVRALTDTGVLLLSAIVGGIGLAMLSFASDIYLVAVAATVFAVGVCYFWPTMLGVVSERVPKGGALALGVIGGMGGLFVGFVTTPMMGRIADVYLHRELVYQGTVDGRSVDRAKETAAALQQVETTYTAWAESLGHTQADERRRGDVQTALRQVANILEGWENSGALAERDTATAFRIAIDSGPIGPADVAASDAQRAALDAKQQATAILRPADNKGGLMSFRYVAPLAVILVVIFGVMFVQDRRRARASPGATNAPGKPGG
ncbi:MAG TPA: MFS transporter [Phycisphaerae bacterium]|nr:MFS transporter [Phycisphaerae bacterium]